MGIPVQGHPWVHSKLASWSDWWNKPWYRQGRGRKRQGSGYVVQSEEFLDMHKTLCWTLALYKPGEL